MRAVGRSFGVLALLLAARTSGAQCTAPVQRLLNARRFEVARASLESQLAKSPNDDAAMNCMGRLLLDKGDVDGAIDFLERAVAANGKSAQHHQWLGLALRAKLNASGVMAQMTLGPRMKEELERAVVLDPTLVEARDALLRLYVVAPEAMGGSIPKAREHAEAILRVNPVRGHIGLAVIAEQQQDWAMAEKEFLDAITARPDSEVAYSAAGGFFRRRERWADAIRIYEKQLALFTADAPVARVSTAHYNLGQALEKSGQTDRAKAEYQAALTANPENANARKALAALP